MVSIPTAFRQSRRLRRWHAPEIVAAGLISLAWVVLLFAFMTPANSDAAIRHLGDTPQMPGMGTQVGSLEDQAFPWGAATAGLPMWLVMTVAMMGPAALPAIRHVCVNSLAWRRGRATAEFGVAYLSLWVVFGGLALALVARLPSGPASHWALVAALAVSAAWQLSPVKRRALRECHRAVPLRPYGRRATLSTLHFGARSGWYCIAACWALMAIMTLAPGPQLVWLAGLTALSTGERLLERPEWVCLAGAAMLSLAAMMAARV